MVPSWFRALAVSAALASSFAASAAASDDSDLLARARTEGQVSFYNSVDIEVAERVKQNASRYLSVLQQAARTVKANDPSDASI